MDDLVKERLAKDARQMARIMAALGNSETASAILDDCADRIEELERERDDNAAALREFIKDHDVLAAQLKEAVEARDALMEELAGYARWMLTCPPVSENVRATIARITQGRVDAS